MSPTTSTTRTTGSSTTGTSTTATVGTLLALIEGDVWHSTEDLVQQALLTDNIRTVDMETNVGKSVAVRVLQEDIGSNSSLVKVTEKVIVPTQLLEANTTVVVVVTEIHPTYLQQKLQGRGMGDLLGVVDVSIFVAETSLELATLEPGSRHGILLKVAETEPADDVMGTCVYLEGETWSTEGVRRASQAELDNAQQLVELPGNPNWSTGVWCHSEHLSVFAFLLRVCESVNILTPEAFAGVVFEAKSWAVRRPALLLWGLLLFLGCVHVYAVVVDRRHQRTGLWFKRRMIEQSGMFDVPFCSLALLVRCRLVAQWGLSPWTLLAHCDQACAKELESLPANASTELSGLPVDILRPFFGPRGLLLRLWTLFRAFHPLLTLGNLPLRISCSQSTKLLTDTVLGSLALQVLVFSLSGEILEEASDELCGQRDLVLGRIAVVVLLSALVNWLLMRTLVHAITRGGDDGGSCSCWNATVRVLGLAWSGFLLTCTLAFLALMSPREEWKWEVALALLTAHLLVVTPLAAALVLSAWIGLAAYFWPELVQHLKRGSSSEPTPEAEPDSEERSAAEVLAEFDEEQKVTVASLAQRGISVQHLLEFYEKLGTVVMPHFNPLLSTTEDVVRQAVVPLSRKDAEEVYGRPPRLKLGLMRLSLQLADTQGAFCRCAVAGRVLLETWPVHALEIDWSLEAEAFGYKPCDVLEISVISQGLELCAGRLQLKELAGQHDVVLWSANDDAVGSVALYVTPPLARPQRSPRPRTTGGCLCCGEPQSDGPELSVASLDFKEGVAYASAVSAPLLPGTLVTHDWEGTFAHLTASVLADALGCAYDEPLQLLEARDMARLRARLGAVGKLKAAYWISAFSVNPHMAICNDAQWLADSTGVHIEPCLCSTPKVHSGPTCEMDQQSATRAYLKGLWLDQGKRLAELHVVSPEFPAVLEL